MSNKLTFTFRRSSDGIDEADTGTDRNYMTHERVVSIRQTGDSMLYMFILQQFSSRACLKHRVLLGLLRLSYSAEMCGNSQEAASYRWTSNVAGAALTCYVCPRSLRISHLIFMHRTIFEFDTFRFSFSCPYLLYTFLYLYLHWNLQNMNTLLFSSL